MRANRGPASAMEVVHCPVKADKLHNALKSFWGKLQALSQRGAPIWFSTQITSHTAAINLAIAYTATSGTCRHHQTTLASTQGHAPAQAQPHSPPPIPLRRKNIRAQQNTWTYYIVILILVFSEYIIDYIEGFALWRCITLCPCRTYLRM